MVARPEPATVPVGFLKSWTRAIHEARARLHCHHYDSEPRQDFRLDFAALAWRLHRPTPLAFSKARFRPYSLRLPLHPPFASREIGAATNLSLPSPVAPAGSLPELGFRRVALR